MRQNREREIDSDRNRNREREIETEEEEDTHIADTRKGGTRQIKNKKRREVEFLV